MKHIISIKIKNSLLLLLEKFLNIMDILKKRGEINNDV